MDVCIYLQMGAEMKKKSFVSQSLVSTGIKNSFQYKLYMKCAAEVNNNFDLFKQKKITKEEYEESIHRKQKAKENLDFLITTGYSI